MLTEAAASVLLPRIVELRSQMTIQRESSKSQCGRHVKMTRCLVCLWLWARLTVMGEEVITLLFTERYLARAFPIFRINLLMLLFNFLPTDPIMRAYPQYRYPMLVLMASCWMSRFAVGQLGNDRQRNWIPASRAICDRRHRCYAFRIRSFRDASSINCAEEVRPRFIASLFTTCLRLWAGAKSVRGIQIDKSGNHTHSTQRQDDLSATPQTVAGH